MLKLQKQVSKGIMFIRLSGDLNISSFNKLSDEINYLLYNQGIHYYVFNFKEIDKIDQNIFLKEITKKQIGSTKDSLFYVNKEKEAFNYICL